MEHRAGAGPDGVGMNGGIPAQAGTAEGAPLEGLTRRLAQHVSSIRIADLPPDVLTKAEQVVADSLACGIAGSVIATDVVGPVGELVAAVRGDDATSLLDGRRLPITTAAFLNATTIHTIDYDDTHMQVVSHFGASVVGAALAATEACGGSGERLLEAVVAGFEVGGRVGRACMPGHYQRWHSTGSLGGLAAAGAAARAMGLDALGTEMAIGLAADDTGSTRVCIKQGDISKSLHAGLAAEKGVRSAALIRAGARGPVGHLEHPVGFFWAYSDERDARRLGGELATLGQTWEIALDDIKAHPCILSSHTAIEGCITLAARHGLAIDDIADVTFHQPPYSDKHGLTYEPETAMAARLSVPYCAVVALEDGVVGMAQFTGDRWLDERVRRLMRLVSIEPDPDLGLRFPGHAPTRTVITALDGRRFTTEIGVAKGSHARPMSGAEFLAKQDELLSYRLDDHDRSTWHRRMQRIAGMDHLADLTALFRDGRVGQQKC
jgi:2-methylcitrate dehydratase PrpD